MKMFIFPLGRCVFAAVFVVTLFVSGVVFPEDGPVPAIPLAGEWSFRMDPGDAGVGEGWFNAAPPDKVTLPGAMTDYGFGEDITADTKWTGTVVSPMWHQEERFAPYREPGNTKILFWLQPEKHYAGPAWYQRGIEIPETFAGKRVVLVLERCHWETRVWVDGVEAGMRNSLSTPHEYDLTALLPPGKHTLALRIDNSLKIAVGENAHSVSDNTQGNWNGVIGKMALEARPKVWVDDLQVYPDVHDKSARVTVIVANATGAPASGTLTLTAALENGGAPDAIAPVSLPFEAQGERVALEATVPLGNSAPLWSEFTPVLHTMKAVLDCGGVIMDVAAVDFGLREFGAKGTQFAVNGQPIFIRGTLECCIFPKTGYPPMDVESWRRVMRALKAHGLNELRFHSWCPPEAAFQAADREGVYFQIECPAWAKVGDGEPIDDFIYAEGDRILKAYGNHPSFCMLAYGNEPAGKNQKEWLGKLVESWKAKDARRLYTSASGWPIIPANQYHVTPTPRAHQWGEGLDSRFNAEPLSTRGDYRDFVKQYDVPVISHEIGQWCVFPNLDEIPKYTGKLKPRNFEIVSDLLEKNHIRDQAHDFTMASGKLQALCYKEEIEAALRTPGFGGFDLLDLHDFPGQGTALVGVLDPFWEEKGYITPEEYRQFAGPVVPLARMDKCIWLVDEIFIADIEIANFGPGVIAKALPVWRLTGKNGKEIASGAFDPCAIPLGNGIRLGRVASGFSGIPAPQQLELTVELAGTNIRNRWPIWIYQENIRTEAIAGTVIAHRLDDAALTTLTQGGKILLLPEPASVRGDKNGPVQMGFSPIFWNTFWTNMQPPHTLGILCKPDDPALAGFPTEFHSNWQWWELIHGGQAMILDAMPPELRPIVQVIDDWNTCRRLGLIFEARVNGGRLLVCGADLETDLEHRPVARQMRSSLLVYMGSTAFNPKVAVPPVAVQDLFQPPPFLRTIGAEATADCAAPGLGPNKALDGTPATFWHTSWEGTVRPYPHWIAVDMKQPVTFEGIRVLQRQDMQNGRIGRCVVYRSDDGENWGEPVGKGRLEDSADWQEIHFDAPVRGRYFKLEAVKPVNRDHPWASLAEVDVVQPK